jgi:hypothetical protein
MTDEVADRIANVEFSSTQEGNHLEMYKKEFPDFQYNLRIYKQIDDMWDHEKSYFYR